MLRSYAIIILVVLGIAGCASVPMGDAKQDAAIKTFTGKPNVAGLYIYRNESMGAAVKMDVAVDGKAIGQTAAKTYLYVEVAPGRHTVTSKSENTDSLEFDALGGRLYYVWQEVKMGVLYARTKLHLVGDDEGKKGVLESQLAASNFSAPVPPPSTSLSSAKSPVPVPYLTDKGQAYFRDFLTKPMPRAFAISDTGKYWAAWGARPRDPSKPIDVKERALQSCKEAAGKDCILYMHNDEIVYHQ